MNLRHTFALTAALLLAAAGARAADVSMAGGSVHFTTPANWLDIMQTQGDPEVHVFQVPDPSPTAATSLARVTVTVKQVGDLSAFNSYRNAADAKARGLTGYHAAPLPADDANGNAYTAQENGAQFAYVEYYWYQGNRAVQLRCVRPAQTQAGAAWMAAFDKGCHALAAQLHG
ncbi:hypothetical protein QMK61_03880 [Fulvimonas sp. R45]|uniref:hypothetical protein n=1 Tax=Fulvimonas sp. R45 TaxID=3045937 RepID=UPI00265E3581|nr:hypothetical protein [Fulvimonas sp. R45]MDO1527964.1 hypothetical protein [Fulvimonas sp. R45]